MLFPEVIYCSHSDRNPTKDDLGSVYSLRGGEILPHFWDRKNWLAVCNCYSLPSVSSEICLFLVQKISTSMEVYSSRRIENAKFSDFFKDCWYAFIWYSSIQHSFGRFVLDFGCRRNIQIFFLSGGVNPLWQLKLKDMVFSITNIMEHQSTMNRRAIK